jgi:hypothetical protein
MRNIILTIEDDSSGQKISGSTTITGINQLYDFHGINGITQLLITLNQELNKQLVENVKISIPDELNILPKGKQW